ncbi:MAG: sialate O-acetylesterase [Acidobacteria bacterium]|nr:sialate O-acetylesterase [Acidobacteriota bacterium]
MSTWTVVLLGLVSALAWAQDLRINMGPAAGSVMQRNAEGRADLRLAGTAPRSSANKFVEARIIGEGGQPLAGFDWRALERVKPSFGWAGDLKDVPQGGPYSVEVRVAGSTSVDSVKDFFVGDLWILAGQSNMEGVGDLIDVEPSDPRVRSFDQSDRWVVANEPLHQLVNAADAVHWRKNKEGVAKKLEGQELEQYVANRKKGAGLGLPFAKEMLRRTGVPVGLLPCAHGGTSMEQWSPTMRDKQGDSLYGATYRRFMAVGSKVRGVLWYQGESDASPKAAPLFAEKFQKLIEAFRADFAQPDLPFYYVQIGRHVAFTNPNEWNAVQDEQRKAESRIPKVGMVSAVDLSIDDIIHISTPDLKRLARRMSDLVMHDMHPEIEKFKPYRRGPRPVNATLEGQTVRILFAEVNGKLVTTGRLAGFSIHGPDGAMLPAVYKAQIDPRDGNSVLLHFGGKLPEGASVRYGAGRDPYVNLNDELDMGAPAFGPLPIAK